MLKMPSRPKMPMISATHGARLTSVCCMFAGRWGVFAKTGAIHDSNAPMCFFACVGILETDGVWFMEGGGMARRICLSHGGWQEDDFSVYGASSERDLFSFCVVCHHSSD